MERLQLCMCSHGHCRAHGGAPLKPSVDGCQPISACRTVEVLCISRRSLRHANMLHK